MKARILLVAAALALSGCTASTTASTYALNSRGLEPIPGSITYGGQPRTRLTKSPVGSTFTHQFTSQVGREVHETYMIEPDRSLRIIDRYVVRERFWD